MCLNRMSRIFVLYCRGPTVAGGDPLPAEPLSGGDGHLQAPAAREPRRPRAQRVRRHVLLQARLLRRLPRNPRRLPSGP